MLQLNGKPFRFAGANIYWLGLQEKNGNAIYPSHFQVDDALATASAMGATVIRSHTLGISTGCNLCIEPHLGSFQQTAFQHIDYAIQEAGKYHLKLIIPLTDNWHYYHGGKHNFTDWRGVNEDQFYADSQVVDDFKQYISMLLNHVNNYTGIAYKDDPTILGWETGNELSAPPIWVQNIAEYIKSIDKNHLIVDGNYEWDTNSSNFLADLQIGSIDIYTGHYYPPSSSALQVQSQQAIQAKKVFMVGEFDWNTNDGSSLADFLPAVEHSGIAGDLYWSLWPHADTYGFVPQNEHFTLHYPGETPDEQRRASMLRTHAYAMQGLSPPQPDMPKQPYITNFQDSTLYWRGAVGAYTYTIERSTQSSNGPWTVLCTHCAAYGVPWMDATHPSGTSWYRVKGVSLSGYDGPYSNPYQVTTDSTSSAWYGQGEAEG
ncbi:hypothetical protein KDH_60680 [Dictyobacter sp. S3.2.2.5]|uniref:mannan endo-1,4-beta-mannosidase n=2 Tax=Dictyobacter halimunensis TaxID=3026934 RepID=A0ABQ6FY74_9CHLR|nr:hypothetical protein KDH_60680 [Dictyobacter sp. S3.2.2.5]